MRSRDCRTARPTTCRPRSTSNRSSSPPRSRWTRPTSGTSNRCSIRRSLTYPDTGSTEQPEAVVGDAGYWHTRQIESIADRGSRCSSRPTAQPATGNDPAGRTASTSRCAKSSHSDRGRTLYALRKITIEPVFGQIKYNRRIDQFMRRGRAAVQSERRLVAATHNLLKLHNHWIANTA